MDGGELGRVVSSPQCPLLQKLGVYVSNLAPVSDVSMRSESLECLDYYGVFNTSWRSTPQCYKGFLCLTLLRLA
jgi:hypothetical protein